LTSPPGVGPLKFAGSAATAKKPESVSQEQIESAVLVIRGEKVLLDADLAAFYGV
jgi:hypothetical protein